jgi:hypothetical protein
MSTHWYQHEGLTAAAVICSLAAAVLASDSGGGSPVSAVARGAETGLTLPAPVARDKRHAVTLAAQPAGLTCSARNGSGSMSGNAANVKVKCPDDSDTTDATARAPNAAGLVLFLGLARSARSSRF